MPVTLADIAARADVSLSTVSRVLNNKEHVSTPTRTAVLEAVTSLGYTREDARRESNSETVFLIVHEEAVDKNDNPAMAQDMERLIVAGVRDTLRGEGIHIQLVQKQLDRIKGFSLPRVSNLAGAINIGSTGNPDLLRKLAGDNVKVVIAGSPIPGLPLDSVTLDFQEAMLKIVHHLAEHGCRTIGLINGPSNATSTITRTMGFRLALALDNLPFAPEQLVSANFSFSAGADATRQILTDCPLLDAIIYAEDDMAVGGLRTLRELGRRVPADIAVVGMFDYEIAKFTDPPLTTIGFDKYEMGRSAAQRLLMRMQGESGPPWAIRLPTHLVVRESA